MTSIQLLFYKMNELLLGIYNQQEERRGAQNKGSALRLVETSKILDKI